MSVGAKKNFGKNVGLHGPFGLVGICKGVFPSLTKKWWVVGGDVRDPKQLPKKIICGSVLWKKFVSILKFWKNPANKNFLPIICTLRKDSFKLNIISNTRMRILYSYIMNEYKILYLVLIHDKNFVLYWYKNTDFVLIHYVWIQEVLY